MADKVITITGLDELIKNIDNFVKFNDTASRLALNRTGSSATVEALKVTRADWNILARDLKATTKGSTKATNSNLEYSYIMSSQSMYLDKFSNMKEGGTRTPSGRKRNASKIGVKYKLKKGKGNLKTLNKSFIKPSKFHGGADRIFVKRPSPTGNSSITAQASITPTSMFKQEGLDAFYKTVDETFTKRYFHELGRLGAFNL